MNYGQLKRQALQLIFSESIAGVEIPSAYNNQADYIRAIPGLANDGMMYIATTVKKIPEVVPLSSLEKTDLGAYTLYRLPDDFWQLMNGGLIWRRPNELDDEQYSYQRYHGYKLYANNRLMIPNNVKNLDSMMVEYYRYPMQLTDNPPDDAPLDNTLETQAALPYYVAAQLVMYDDSFRHASLWNAFETRMNAIREPVTVEFAPVDDAYAGFNYPGI